VSVAAEVPVFVIAAGVSLTTSHVLAQRIEMVAEALGLSEALLGVVAALAADAPEITSAVAAISNHHEQVGAGVVLGSGVFNLAALLGLAAVVAGEVRLHRRSVLLGGVVAVALATLALVTVNASVDPGVTVWVAAAVLAVFGAVLGTAGTGLRWLPLPPRGRGWLTGAVAEEEEELEEALRPEPGGPGDGLIALIALVVVIVTSVIMERSAVSIGNHFGVPEIVIGAVVLGVVTGIPNAVASTYLARKGRGAAALSTALNSNNINIFVGLLVPAAVVGLGPRSGDSVLVACWLLGLTIVTVTLAYRFSGLRRGTGVLTLMAYALFVGTTIGVAAG
jgi:cation:H+ antiporter